MRILKGGASRCGTASLSCVAVVLSACAGPSAPAERDGSSVHRAPDPSKSERYCAWFGEASDGVLYFGQAAFWSAYRAFGNDPRADLREPGPRLVGRFNLEHREFSPPLELGGSEPRSGVWDVLPMSGRIYFTSYFEEAGYVDPLDGSVTIFGEARFWNELSAGPPGRILVSRYADAAGGGGAVLEISSEGEVLAEHALAAPSGVAFAAKSPAWDPIRDEIWVTTDRLPLPEEPQSAGGAFARPTIVLDRQGVEVARFGTSEAPVEIQFVRFDSEGRGYLSVSTGGALDLVVLSPETDRRDWGDATRIPLDVRFPSELDFAQDIQLGADGSVYVTRWSGIVHRISSEGHVRTWALPHPPDSLYYTAVPTPTGICATRCGDVEVVCAPDSAARSN